MFPLDDGFGIERNSELITSPRVKYFYESLNEYMIPEKIPLSGLDVSRIPFFF